ncbi:hypothetical protein [Halomicronema sp. CCY15110]|uniref:hypothetical protein n=1 Tax=Halomicronema sp. CCY15110 TaxID=2767773 RepID=UPI00194E226D|nr:hypothetical protein [Halomicronema sp. CCY15110]
MKRRIKLTTGRQDREPIKKKEENSLKGDKSTSYTNFAGVIYREEDGSFLLLGKEPSSNELTGEKYVLREAGVRKAVKGIDPEKLKSGIPIICTLRKTQHTVKGKAGANQPINDISHVNWVIHTVHLLSLSEQVKVVSLEPTEIEKSKEEISIEEQSMLTSRGKVFEYLGGREEAEREISDILQKHLGGQREVMVEDGRIDLLTDKLLIEVKASSRWDDTIGQVLKYKRHYPNHHLVVFLFDDGFDIKFSKSKLEKIIENYIAIPISVCQTISDLEKLQQR